MNEKQRIAHNLIGSLESMKPALERKDIDIVLRVLNGALQEAMRLEVLVSVNPGEVLIGDLRIWVNDDDLMITKPGGNGWQTEDRAKIRALYNICHRLLDKEEAHA